MRLTCPPVTRLIATNECVNSCKSREHKQAIGSSKLIKYDHYHVPAWHLDKNAVNFSAYG